MVRSPPVIATYVIGLREGLEAALIVGIVAAFLRQQGQRAALRYVWIGVAIAVTVCIAVGVALQILDQELPQRQQEQLETVVGLFAVLIVTFMIVWMRRHAAGLRGELERSAAAAVATGSVFALVGMAFFAVLREGLETAVFLLAAFQAADNALIAGLGALLGIVTAVVIGAGSVPGRDQDQPGPLLPNHLGVPGAGRRRPAGDRRSHRARGGVAQQPAGTGAGPELAGRSRARSPRRC